MFNREKFLIDTIVLLNTQGTRAMDQTTLQCRYNLNGLKCAIGVHIPEELYDPAMEDKSVQSILVKFPKLKEYFESKYGEITGNASVATPTEDYAFLNKVQLELHDYYPSDYTTNPLTLEKAKHLIS